MATASGGGDSPGVSCAAARQLPRRRRLTLAPAAALPSPDGSRFACLADGLEQDGDSLGTDAGGGSDVVRSVLAAGFDAEEVATVSEAELAGGRKVLSDEELHDEFWSFVGFPTRESRYWERSDPDEEPSDVVPVGASSGSRGRSRPAHRPSTSSSGPFGR